MVRLHLPIKSRFLVLSVSLLLTALLFLVGRSNKEPTNRILEEPCIQHLTHFKKRLFYWPTFVPFLWKAGDDVIDSVLKLKEFEGCLMQKKLSDPDPMNAIQEKLFPYLNLKSAINGQPELWPTWIRWNYEVYRSSTPHFSLTDNSFHHVEPVAYDNTTSFWNNWYTSMIQASSKGIAISIGDRQVSDTVKLIRVLRYLGNSLPIQLVHKGDLSSDKVGELFEAARNSPSDGYPPQELWILDVASLLNPAHIQQFKRFSNKWLALLFCSFEAPILLDADTVPFSSLEAYYDTNQFKEFGTVFFKDRTLTGRRLNNGQRRTLKRIVDGLLTSASSRHAHSYYGIQDPIAKKTLQNMLDEGYKHFMESGLVVYDKKRHLFGLLTSIALQFSSIKEYFHGDKEWFWISQLIRGVPFSFHAVDASSVGKIERAENDEYRVCSVQLSHTDKDGSILWLNGGLRTCKFDSWEWEYQRRESLRSVFDSSAALEEVYRTPVELQAAVIPDFERRPWAITEFCMGFYYCAYYQEHGEGKLIQFDEAKKHEYKQIVERWNG